MWRGIRSFLLIALFVHPQFTNAQIPPKVDPVDAIMADGDITWIDWWETNRDTYIRKILQKGRLDAAADAPKDISAKVVDALLEATRSDSRNVRAEAAFALARMGKGSDRLLELTTDPDERVRCRAWVCLGLLQKEAELLQADKLDDAESLAVITGLGLLDKPTGKAVERLRLTARSAKYVEAQRMAIWALRVYHNLELVSDKKKVDNALLLDLLRTSESPAVVSEALLAMGTIGGWENLPQLLDVAQLGSQTSSLPAFAGAKQGNWQVKAMRGAACLALAQLNGATKKPGQGMPSGDPVADRKAIEFRNTILRHNIAYGSGPGPFQMYPQPSVLALARLGETRLVEEVLKFGTRPPIIYSTNGGVPEPHIGGSTRDPERAFAAIGIGVYGGDTDLLRLYAASTHEPANLRAACAVAIGLSNHGDSDALAQLANKLDPNTDARIYGHIVLAFGLMQDGRALQYASRFGLGGADAIDSDKILKSDFESKIHCEPQDMFPFIENINQEMGTRAALLGLAVLNNKAAKPALLANWGNDQWITLESSRAMGWCGIYDGVDPMLILLKQHQKKNIQAWTARCLGEIFDRNQPSNLSRLTEGNYYAYPIKFTDGKWIDFPPNRNPRDREANAQLIEREFQGLDNPFLYWQILPGIDGNFYTPETVKAKGALDGMIEIPGRR